jgi:hypothetical protein
MLDIFKMEAFPNRDRHMSASITSGPIKIEFVFGIFNLNKRTIICSQNIGEDRFYPSKNIKNYLRGGFYNLLI